MLDLSRECMFLGSLSRHNKDLEQGTYTRVTLTFYKTRQLATWLQVSLKCQVQTGFQAYSSKKK